MHVLTQMDGRLQQILTSFGIRTWEEWEELQDMASGTRTIMSTTENCILDHFRLGCRDNQLPDCLKNTYPGPEMCADQMLQCASAGGVGLVCAS